MFTFIESPLFERMRSAYFDDEQYAELQEFLIHRPEEGSLVRGAGGVRKLRWRRAGSGKRGGLRVIYFVRHSPREIWLLTVYAKAKQESVPSHVLKQLKKEFGHE